MKNRTILIIKLLFVVCFAWVFIYIIDNEFNGIARELLAQIFVYQRYDVQGNQYDAVNWGNVSTFFSMMFLTFCVLIFFAKNFYQRYIQEKQKAKDTEIILRMMEDIISTGKSMSEDAKQFPEIENILLQQKMQTEQKEQLYQSETRQKNDLITYLAHDMKTPLASIIGYMSLLDEVEEMPQEQRKKYTSIALKKGYRLEELMNEFFEITRFNLQHIALQKTKIDLRLMLLQLAEEFYPIVEPLHKKVLIEMKGDIEIFADSDKLARVFNNILKNAVSYSYPNTDIYIEAKQMDQNVVITFKNRGDQIPAYQLEHIFEKFYRADVSRSSSTGGAGLGLAIAKRIVEAHHGEIQAQSNEEFTIFYIKLPI